MKNLAALVIALALHQIYIVYGHQVSKNLGIDPKGMVVIDGHTYYFSLDGVFTNAAQATTFCSEIDMKLLVLDTEEKNTLIKNYLRDKGLTSGYWTGGRGSMSWTWDDSSSFSYTDWSIGQPNNDLCDLQLCISIDMFGWADYTCDGMYGWICE